MLKLYRHSKDIPASLLVLVVFASQLWIYFSIESPLHVMGFTFVLLIIQVSSGAICHNHHHVNTFTKGWINRIYEIIMYLETGTSPYSWTIHHNIGHHQHYLNPEKDPSSWQEPDGTSMNRIRYDIFNAFLIYPEIFRIGKQHPVVYKKFKRMFLISNLLLAALTIYNPINALIIFIIPMLLLLIILLDNTYQQHADTFLDSHYVASRNVMHPLYNLTSWNLGFHTAHHIQPGLHWSQLPELHEKIKNKIPDYLISDKLLYVHKPASKSISDTRASQEA